MPRRKMTEEEKKAWGAKMKALREAKKQGVAKSNLEPGIVPGPKRVEDTATSEREQATPVVSPSAQVEEVQGETELEQLKRHVQELQGTLQTLLSQQQAQPASPPAFQGAQVTPGGVVGRITKFSVKPSDYPDPRDRLFQEQRLILQGFNRSWWDLDWSVTTTNYDGKDGLKYAEPKFQLKLIRILPDPDTQEPSNKRYVLWKGSFFEDPAAAMQIADQYGLPIDESNEKLFLDEMRYLRIRDWLMEAFYPPKPAQDKMNKREMVIDNRVVDVYEVNSTQAETIPFGELKRKF